MSQAGAPLCAICGEEKRDGQVWFLILGCGWEDKLRILQWHDKLSTCDGVYRLCCPAHVQELVVHWMTTGSLDYPFAQVLSGSRRRVTSTSCVPTVQAVVDTRHARQIGELAVHRESLRRALSEDPESLQVILSELFAALEKEVINGAAEIASRDALLLTVRPA